jgi:hypothetical protein
MKIDQVIAIFERVGNDYPTEMNWRIDPTTGVETMTLTEIFQKLFLCDFGKAAPSGFAH